MSNRNNLANHADGPVLLRLGTESPALTTGCSPRPEDCDASRMQPVDVYCVEHERFLPLASELPGRRRLIVVVILRALLCGAVLLTAYLDNAVPVYLAAVGVGAALVGLPLRRYRVGWRFAVSVWLVACAGVLGSHYVPPLVGRIAGTIAVLVVLAVGVLLAALVAMGAARRRAHKLGGSTWPARAARWAGAAAGAAMVTPAALLLYLGVRVQPPDWFLSSAMGRSLVLLFVFGGAGSALVFAAVGGVVLGLVAPIRRPGIPLRVPAPPATLRWATQIAAWSGPTHGPIERLYRVLTTFLLRVAAAATTTARGLANLSRTMLHKAAVFGVTCVNWLYRLVVITGRRVVASLVATGRILRLTASLASAAGRRTIRVLLVPVVAVTAAAWLADRFAAALRTYLVDGSLVALAWTGGLLLGGSALLAVAWLALCGLPLGWSLPSLARSTSVAAANMLLILSVGGWVIGLPGTFGPGPVRVGWVTLGSTALLVVAAVVMMVRKHRTAGKPQTGRPARDPQAGLLVSPGR